MGVSQSPKRCQAEKGLVPVDLAQSLGILEEDWRRPRRVSGGDTRVRWAARASAAAAVSIRALALSGS